MITRSEKSDPPPPSPARPAPRPERKQGWRARSKTRVAVIGAGFISDFHLQILRGLEHVELVAVCDADPTRARRAAERFAVPHAVTSTDELPRHDIDVAHVLVPPDRHAELVRELLEKGIGVFVEKPLALSAAEARSLVELASEHGVPLGVNHNAVHRPVFRQCLAAIQAGRIGRVEHVQVTLSVPLRQLDAQDYSHWMFRAPENIVFEQATHPFSQLVELVGALREMDVSILGTRELDPGQLFHHRWVLGARAERGTAELYLAFGEPFTRSTLQVLGTDGSIELDLHHDHFTLERKTKWLDFWNGFLAGWRRGRGLRRSARKNLLHYALLTLGLGPRRDGFFLSMRDSISAFHAALRAGERLPTDGQHGVRVLEWCEAAVADLAPASPAQPLQPTSGEARPDEVCVLGANGFIGRHTLAALHARELPTTAVVRRLHSLPPVITEGVSAGDLRLARASLTEADALAEAVRGSRVVIHLATGGGAGWEEIERAMVHGSVALAEACLQEKVERLIFVSSTAALYLGRDAGKELGDDVPADPRPDERALYSRGKVAAERELLRLHRERGLPVTIVRPAIVVGPGTALQHGGIGLWVRDNHCVGWGLGTTPLPLVLAEDVAAALALLAAHRGTELDGRALNLASRAEITARELVAVYRRETGRDFHFHPRPLLLSQTLELGKWVVKKVGRRKDAQFPSYRDLKSREMAPRLRCERARELGWRPCDDGDELVRRFLGPSPS